VFALLPKPGLPAVARGGLRGPPSLRFGVATFALLRERRLEATPGIEPGYTVLQPDLGLFAKLLMLTRFPHKPIFCSVFSLFLVALNGFSQHSRGTSRYLAMLTFG
jgi:hypothetical protein